MTGELVKYSDKEIFFRSPEQGPFASWDKTLVIASPFPLFTAKLTDVIMEERFNNKPVLNDGILAIARTVQEQGVRVAVWHQPLDLFKHDTDFQITDALKLDQSVNAVILANTLQPDRFYDLFPEDVYSQTLWRVYNRQPVELLFARRNSQKCLFLTDYPENLIEIPNVTSLVKGTMKRISTDISVTDAFIRRQVNQSFAKKLSPENLEKHYQFELEKNRKRIEQNMQRTREQVLEFFKD